MTLGINDNGQAVVVPATFIDSSDLQITLDKSSLTQPVGFSITVVNPQSAPSNAVTFTLGTQVPQISAVTNAASFATGPFAPGEIVTIFGTNLTGAATFDNISATLVYASATQVSVTVRYSIAGPKTTLQVGYSIPVQLNVTASAPGIFAAVPAGNVLTLYATGCGALPDWSKARIRSISKSRTASLVRL